MLDAAAQVGYSPSFAAQALVRGRAPIISVVIADIADPYFAEIARGVESIARRLGYLAIHSSAYRSARTEIEHVRAAGAYRATGLLLAASGYAADPHNAALAAAVEELRASGTRVVKLAHRELDVPSVTFDNQAAAYDITDYVASLGHRRIAFVEGPPGFSTSVERCAGFEAAMSARDLDPGLRFEGGFTYEAGLEAARHIVSTGEPPDAVIGVNDNVAIGVLMGLRQAGVDVPGTVSVAGIDDTPPSRYVGLTTVSMPLHDLGVVGAQAVLPEGGPKDALGEDTEHIVLPHQLTARSTTARRAARGALVRDPAVRRRPRRA